MPVTLVTGSHFTLRLVTVSKCLSFIGFDSNAHILRVIECMKMGIGNETHVNEIFLNTSCDGLLNNK